MNPAKIAKTNIPALRDSPTTAVQLPEAPLSMTKRKRRSTANIEPHEPNHEYSTLTKAKAQGTIEFLSAKGLLKKNRNTKLPIELPTQHDIFNFFDIRDRSGQNAKQAENPTDQGGETARRTQHQSTEEQRAPKGKVNPGEIKKQRTLSTMVILGTGCYPGRSSLRKQGLLGIKRSIFIQYAK